eukprot:scaffold167_cov244-Pinguiococcus_pyrenoidosus.AAC.5
MFLKTLSWMPARGGEFRRKPAHVRRSPESALQRRMPLDYRLYPSECRLIEGVNPVALELRLPSAHYMLIR